MQLDTMCFIHHYAHHQVYEQDGDTSGGLPLTRGAITGILLLYASTAAENLAYTFACSVCIAVFK